MPVEREWLAEVGRLANGMGPLARTDGNELLASIANAAREVFGAAACSIALLTDDQQELVFTTSAGAGSDAVSGMRMPVSSGLAGWVVMSGQPIAVDDLAGDTRFARNIAEDTGYVPNAILAVPVQTPRRLLGVLSLLDRDTTRAGADDDMRLMAEFADQAALAVESMQAAGRLGRTLLSGLAARTDDTELAAALRQVADELPEPDDELARLAALFADLEHAGEEERELALQICERVLAYVRRRRAGWPG